MTRRPGLRLSDLQVGSHITRTTPVYGHDPNGIRRLISLKSDIRAGRVFRITALSACQSRSNYVTITMTDGYYTYKTNAYSGSTFDGVVDQCVAATIEAAHDGKLRPARKALRWKITLNRKPYMRGNVAYEMFSVKAVKPAELPTIHSVSDMPIALLHKIGASAKGTYSDDCCDTLRDITRLVTCVKWARVTNAVLTGYVDTREPL
jgi:hypothetical protein